MTARLEVHELSVRFGRFEAVTQVSLSVEAGTIAGLIGPNGAGKTSLLDAVTGLGPRPSGSIALQGVPVTKLAAHDRARRGLGRTFQALELFEDLTVGENLAVGAESVLGNSWRRRDAASVMGAIQRAAALTGLSDVLDRVPTQLAHGQRKRVALARALAGGPEVLLLDEPAGGLDATERAALTKTLTALARGGTSILLVDHDMALVMDVCREVWVLDQGRIVGRGTPAEVRADPVVAAAYLGAEATTRRPCRDEGAHLTLERGKIGRGGEGGGGEVVARAADLATGYAGVPIVSDLNLEVRGGEVVALLGSNGAGKTTTLRALSGLLPITGGRAEVLGVEVRGKPQDLVRRGMAHAPQDRGVLPALTVAENLRLAARFDRAGVDFALERLARLNPLVDRRAGNLSGGEQQLLAIGRALAARARLVLLDEVSLGLAPSTRSQVLETVRSVADSGAGVVIVEQHPRLALEIADRAYVMRRGRVVLEGTAAEVGADRRALEEAYLE